MRKGRDGGKNVDKNKTDDYSGHYVIVRSRPPEGRPLKGRPLERLTLVPRNGRKIMENYDVYSGH